jgi:hypothetical protein
MKAYGGVEVQLPSFLTLALIRDEWPGSCPGHNTADVTLGNVHLKPIK